MQFNQPFWSTGFQNNAQFPPYQIHPQCPEVIGEGDVMSFMLPDGSIQSYFVPINRRDLWIKNQMNYKIPNIAPSWSSPYNEAWFVRSIFNTYPGAGSYQQVPYSYGSQSAKPLLNFEIPGTVYVQKFHNDNWTSTTDLHYFYPQLRHEWATKGCTAVQVEIPREGKTIFDYGTVCNRPCYCVSTSGSKKTQTYINESCCTDIPMLVDEMKSEIVTECCCHKFENEDKKTVYKSNKLQNSKTYVCVCHSRPYVNTSDKAITTYTDQASSSFDIIKRGEKCYPRKTRTKRNTTRSLNNDVDECYSACCLGSPCRDTDKICTK